MVIENDARLAWFQVSNAALQRVKIPAIYQPCMLRPKRKWQTADPHQICDTHDGWRTYQQSSGTNNNASACNWVIILVVRNWCYHLALFVRRAGTTLLSLPWKTATSHFRGDHLAAVGRLVKVPAFVEMHH
jgi:hypothetical protein